MVQKLIFVVRILVVTITATTLCIFSGLGAEDLYTIRSIKLDATASDSNTARSHAIAEGQEEAFIRLLEKLTLPMDHSRIPLIARASIGDYVQDFEISNEKRSDQRYLAELTVRFKRARVKEFLVAAGVPFSETETVPIIVLPIYRVGEEAILWEDSNPWREAWRRLEIKNELVNLIVPIGQLADVMAINAEQALAGNREFLRKFAMSYGAEETLVAVASISSSSPDKTSVDVTIQNFGITVSTLGIERFEMLEGEIISDFLGRAVAQVAERLEHDWKVSNLLSFDEEDAIRVAFPIEGWSHWRSLISRLQQISVVQDVEITGISRREASLTIRFLGEVDRLAVLLLKKDIRLEQVNGGWGMSVGANKEMQVEKRYNADDYLDELPELLPGPGDIESVVDFVPPPEDNAEDLFIE
jgi:hypothetical protein